MNLCRKLQRNKKSTKVNYTRWKKNKIQTPSGIFEIVNVTVQLYQRVATNKPPIKTDIAKDKTVALKEIRKCQTFKQHHTAADKCRTNFDKKRVDKDNVGWKQNEEEDDTIWDLFH